MAGPSTRDLVSGLDKPRRGKKQLVPRKPQGAIIPTAGRGLYTDPGAKAGGIASPLTETEGLEGSTTGSRKYSTNIQLMRSTDGIFLFEYYNPLELNFKDANSADVKFILKDIPPIDPAVLDPET